MVYKLFINGVDYEDFKTLKEIDKFLFDKGIDNNKYHIRVIKMKKNISKQKCGGLEFCDECIYGNCCNNNIDETSANTEDETDIL